MKTEIDRWPRPYWRTRASEKNLEEFEPREVRRLLIGHYEMRALYKGGQGRYGEAERVLKRVLATKLRVLGLAYPDATVTKSKRKGKTLIDYLRNGRGATAVAPYSTRAGLVLPYPCHSIGASSVSQSGRLISRSPKAVSRLAAPDANSGRRLHCEQTRKG